MHFDILVVGNGIVACAIADALTLRDKTLRVGIVGPRVRPGSATLAAGAMLGLVGELEADGLGSEVGRQKWAFAQAASRLWADWAARLGVLISRGTHVIDFGVGDAVEMANFEAMGRIAAESGISYAEVALDRVPGVRAERLGSHARAWHVPDEGFVEPAAVMGALDEALGRAGVERVDGSVVAIRQLQGSAAFEVEVQEGSRLFAERVVVAAGAESRRVVEGLPVAEAMLKLYYGVGVGLHVRGAHRLQGVVRSANRGFASGLHAVPQRNGDVYVGATNTIVERSFEPSNADSDLLYHLANQSFDFGDVSPKRVRAVTGYRPITEDGYPLLGETSLRGFYMATGTKRDGLFLSPAIAATMADVILSQASGFHPLFAPERKPIRTLTRELGVAKTIEHLRSVILLRGEFAGLTGSATDAELRAAVERVYDQAGIEDYGIAPEMWAARAMAC